MRKGRRNLQVTLATLLALILAFGGIPAPALAEMAEEAMGEEPVASVGRERETPKQNEGELGTESQGAEASPSAGDLAAETREAEPSPAEGDPSAAELATEGSVAASQASLVQQGAEMMGEPTTFSMGPTQSSAVKSDGSLWTWGSNSNGVLGNGASDHDGHPTPAKVMDDVVAVSMGGANSAAIKSDGSLWMWGWNGAGSLGNGVIDYDAHPTPAKVMDDVAAVSLGSGWSAAIKNDGSLWTWGWNYYGALGNGTKGGDDHPTPAKVMDDVVAVSLGGSHSAAIKSDGSLWTWGDNNHGQLGNGTTTSKFIPAKVMDDVAAVSLGGTHSAAIKSDGSLWIWGDNGHGQLGNGARDYDDHPTPVKVMDDVVAVSLGADNTAAIKSDGSLWTWGWNGDGQLGDGTTTYKTVPVKVMDGVSSVSLAGRHSAAIKSDGTLWIWGWNNYGQLGDGTTTNRTTPIKVMDGVAVTQPSWQKPTDPGQGPQDPSQPGTSFKITSATATIEGKTVDLLREEAEIELEGAGFLNFPLSVQYEGDEVQGLKYKLCQIDANGNSKTIAQTGSGGEFLGIRYTDLSADATTLLRAYDGQDNLVDSKQLWLKVGEAPPEPTSIEIGKEMSIQIQEWPFNGAGVSLEEFDIPVGFYADSDGTFRATLNIDVDELKEKFGFSAGSEQSDKEDRAKALKMLKDPEFLKNIVSGDGSMNTFLADKKEGFGSGGGNLKPVFTFAGYLEGVRSGSGYKLAGEIAVSCEVEWDHEFQEVVVVVPVVAAVTVTGSATLAADMNVNYLVDGDNKNQWKDLKITIAPNLEAALGLYGGVGVAEVASVGVFGEGAIGLNATIEMIDINNRTRLDEVYLKGQLGLAARFLGEQYSLTLIDSDEQPIYKNNTSLGTNSDTGQLGGQGSSDIPRLISQQQGGDPIDRSYVGSESAWNGNAADGAECLRRNMYPASEVCMTNVADGQLMVFLDDDSVRGDSNRSMLMWSRYSSSAKTWSEPQPVWQDGTADFLPSLCSDGSGGAWVTWSNAREALQDNKSLADTASRLDVSVAHFDSGSGSMVNPEFVTNNDDAFELSPRVGTGPDGPVVAWSENPLGDLFGIDGGRSICIAERSGGSWSIDRIAEPTARVTSVAVGRVGDEVSVAWSEDADGTTDTMDDSSVRYWRRNEGISNVENGHAFNPRFASAGGVPALTWCEGDAMMYTTDGTANETGLAGIPQTSYSVSGDLLDNAAIAYVLYKGGKGNMFTRWGRVGEWSDSLALTSQDGVITSWSASIESGVPAAVFATTVGGADAAGETSLCNTIGSTKSCAVVESAYCQDGTIHATIRNAGILPLADATVYVREGENVVGSATAGGSIAPGENRSVEIPIGSLADNERHTFHVSVDPPSANAGPKVVEVNGLRLRTSMKHYLSSTSEDFVASVSNEGGAEITDGVVTFYNYDNPDETLSTIPLEPLGVGQSVDVKYEGGTSLHSSGVNGVGVRVESCGQVAATDVLPTWTLGFVSEEVPSAGSKTFPDVPANAWYAGVVGRAVQLGLFNGYGDGRFGPDDKVTRGQVAVILWNMAGKPESTGMAAEFADVKEGAYYYDAVRWARSVGVVNGYGSGIFGPEDPVTREQLAAMLSSYAGRVAGRDTAASADDYGSMSDAGQVSGWAAESVGWCFRNGIISGTGDGRVNPQGNATRAEAAKMVVFLHDLP